MKLFLKAIALAAKDPNFKGNPRQELNNLIDVAESSGLVVWHDDFCFKSSFWDWGNRESGTVNWGGYGSSYKPSNESYFKFQYPGDTATFAPYGSTGKLVTRKDARPLDAVKALILPEADADGTMQALLAKAGANPVIVADKGLKTDEIVDLLTKQKCNFLLTADEIPAGLTEAIDKASADGDYFFTLPVGRLRPLLEKPTRAPGVRGPKAPPAFADKDDAKAYTKLKALLLSQKFEEIDQAISLLPALPGVCDKLLEGITLGDGVSAWTNDPKTWTSDYNRPSCWGDNHTKLPYDFTRLGDSLRLAEIPKNDLFNTSEPKRYALFSVINAAPEDCAPAKAIREGLIALHWNEYRLPPLTNFSGLRHLYLTNSSGVGFKGNLASISHEWQPGYNRPDPIDLDWLHAIKSLRRIDLYFRDYTHDKSDEFLKKASFPVLEELNFEKYKDTSPALPPGIRSAGINDLWVSHERLPELLTIPGFHANSALIARQEHQEGSRYVEPTRQEVEIVPVKDRGEPLAAKELSALKKLLRDDSPEIVMQGLKILHTATPSTIDALLDRCSVEWDPRGLGHFGGYWPGRLCGPLFDSIKRNPLGEAVRMNLISLATPGFEPVDDIRNVLIDIVLPPSVVPIDVSGFNGIYRLKITVDPSKSSENWITGLEKLTSLQMLELHFEGGSSFTSLEKALPLDFQPPPSVTEMEITYSFRDVLVSPDFITVSPNLRKLTIELHGKLEEIAKLRGMDPTKLEELNLKYYSINDKSLAEDLTGLSPFVNLRSLRGSRSSLKSLNGVSGFKNLRAIELESDSLEDISELPRVTTLESLKLGDRSGQELPIGDLAALPLLNSLDFGRHRVVDPQSLLKFRPDTVIKAKALGTSL